jgi:hypothetical protein
LAKAKPFDGSKLPFDYGVLESVAVKKIDGAPLIVTLADGTVLEIRTVVMEIKRSKDRYDAKGDPVYAVGTAQLVTAKIPAKLKIKKVKK